MGANLYAQEEWVNVTGGYMEGGSEVYETFTASRGDLYRACAKDYGRCTGRIYVDVDGKPKPVGWVFTQRRKYEDSDGTYLAETWVTIHTGPPTKTIQYHYA